jgi:hypothetical protein
VRTVRLLALIGLVGVVMSCGGADEEAADTSVAPAETSTTAAPAPSSGDTDPDEGSSAQFPVPIVEDGQIVSEFPGEVTVSYPEAMLEPLIDFYEGYALERGGVGGELFEGGIEYQFEQEGDTVAVSVTPEPPNAIVFIRVLP